MQPMTSYHGYRVVLASDSEACLPQAGNLHEPLTGDCKHFISLEEYRE